jgi:cyanobactin maturation PatA/PatG family protease
MREPEVTESVADLTLLWRLTTGDPDICVAVIDGAVDLTHPCFEGAALTAIDGASREPTRHGTEVASLLFGQHGSNVTGIAPRCRGLIVPVYAPVGDGSRLRATQLDLARAITTAVERGAHVVNVSGGEGVSSPEPERFLADALRLCAERDVLVIGAAGNGGCDCVEVPAAVPTVLAVGASDGRGMPSAFSNWNDAYRDHGVVFLGRDLIAAVPGGGVTRVTGTSFATALVSGIAALLLSVQHALGQRASARVIRQALLDSAAPCALVRREDCQRLLRGEVRVMQALARVLASAGEHVMAAAVVPAGIVPAGFEGDAPNEPEDEAPGADAKTSMQLSAPPAESARATEDTGMSAVVARDNSGTGSIGSPPPGVRASGCGCGGACTGGGGCSCGGAGTAQAESSLAYVLAQIGYDFGSWTRYEWYAQQMTQRDNPKTGTKFGSPLDRPAFIDYLNYIKEDQPGSWESVIWTLEFDTVPVYAVQPVGPYADKALERIKGFFQEQVLGKQDPPGGTNTFKSERCSIPGYLTGRSVTLMNGLVVPVIAITDRGLYNWSIEWLIHIAKDKFDTPGKVAAEQMLRQFFEKVYYQLRNLGRTPQERALNYAGTNVYQLVEQIIDRRPQDLLTTMIQNIRVEKTPICRPGSDCWDVIVTVFNPEQVTAKARIVTRITIDVSDVVPVTVGQGTSWPEF